MKKKLLILILLPNIIIPANYKLTRGKSIFPTWTQEYDSQVKQAAYNEDNPPLSHAPSYIWGNHRKDTPLPTNRWFNTLAISGDIKYTESGTKTFTQPFPVITFPYIIQALIQNPAGSNPVYPGLMISLPEKQYITTAGNTSTAYSCQENNCDKNPLDVGDIVPPPGTPANYPFSSSLLNITPYSIIFSCAEQNELEDPIIVANTEFSPKYEINQNLFGIKLLFKLKNEKVALKKQRFTTNLVRGMPFVTAEFSNTTPMLQFPGQAVLRLATLETNAKGETILTPQINGNPPTTLTGTSFIIQLNSSQSWFVFSSLPITLNYNSATNEIIASEPFNGLVQIMNYTIPQIQPPAIPLPLPPIPSAGEPSWRTINPQKTYTHYEQYFNEDFFPAVQTWYQTTYLGTQYVDQMPDLKLPENPTGQNIYNYYFNPESPSDPNTYYGQLYNDWQTQTSPKSQTNLNKLIINALTKLQSYSGIYPVGGDVAFSISENNPTLTINWKTNIPATETKNLLMLCLPHHQDLLVQPNYETTITYDSIRGPLKAVLGIKWTLNYPKPKIGSATNSWQCENDHNIRKPEFKEILKEYLTIDALTVPTATDSYGFGKEIARTARLALIADQINNPATMDEKSLVLHLLSTIKNALKPWIKRKNENPFFYEPGWGGVCTQNGLLNHNQDYGMGWYNDHHFHFGYFIYAAAVYLQLSKHYQETDSKFDRQLISFTKELIKDIANPNFDDDSYPYFRMMDWYLGHSLAAGIFPFGNGKNQESTSEAVNAWYGIYLFGLATANIPLEILGSTLLAAEINAAQTYWYMMPATSSTQPSINSDIYPPIFNKLACVGVLWETKADYATFFGTNVEYINLIHFLPFTPASEALIPQAWNAYQYELLKTSLTRTVDPVTGQADPLQSSWRSFVHMSQAISSPEEAQKALDSFIQDINTAKLNPFDNGNSATNMLYWLLTRPNFIPTGTIPKYTPSTPTPGPGPTPTPTPKPKPGPTPTPTPKPKPGPTPTPTPKPKPGPTPTPTPSSTPIPAPGRLVPGLPADPQIAESMGYTGASESIQIYIDYIKTNYLEGIINWYIQTYPSEFPNDISLEFTGSSSQDIYNNFSNSEFYQTLVKHYNNHPKTPYYHIPAGANRPPLPGIPGNWPPNYLNNFIQQTFITAWYIPNIGAYNGYTSVPTDVNKNEITEDSDQMYDFLINIYAPAYLQWIQKLQKS